MKKIIIPLAVFFLALVLSSCEKKEEYITYEKLSYINEDAFLIVEGDTVYNPMRNVPWLNGYQKSFDEQPDILTCLKYPNYGSTIPNIFTGTEVVLSFIPYQDSVKRVMTAHDAAYLYNTDGSEFYIDNICGSWMWSLDTKINDLVNEIIYNKNIKPDRLLQSNPAKVQTRDCPSPPEEAIDSILNNATEIEVLSFYKYNKILD